MLNVNYRNTRKKCEICSKLTIKTPERSHWRRSGVFIVRAITCQGPPEELVNWNLLILQQFFIKYFLRPWNSYFSKKMFHYFNKLWAFCVYKRMIFCSASDTVKCHWKFVEFGGKVKQCIRIGSSSLSLLRNNTQSHGIEHCTKNAVFH